MNKSSNKFSVLDYLFVLRPMLFFPGWATLLAGYFVADKSVRFWEISTINALPISNIFMLLLMFGAAMGASFLLNQIQDIESDRGNKKLFFISEGIITKRSAVVESAILIILALFLSVYFNPNVLFLTLAFMLLTGYLYNFPPFNFKDKPWHSLIANSLMGWLAFAIGWASVRPLSAQIIGDSMPYLLLNTALYFYTTLPDMDGDAQSGKQTLAVVYGLKKILIWAFLLFVFSMTIAFINNDFIAQAILLLSLPFFVTTIRNIQTASAVRTTKYTILFFNLVISFKIPYYFGLMVLVFFATRWFFKKRFNYDYPNFKG